MNQRTTGNYRSFKGRAIDPSRRVRVYRNLNNGKISIKQGSLVVGHTDSALMKDTTFLVFEKLRQKVLVEKRKSVHAYIEGFWVDSKPETGEGVGIWYNPYLTDVFRITGTDEPCEPASYMLVKSDGSMTMWQ